MDAMLEHKGGGEAHNRIPWWMSMELQILECEYKFILLYIQTMGPSLPMFISPVGHLLQK